MRHSIGYDGWGLLVVDVHLHIVVEHFNYWSTVSGNNYHRPERACSSKYESSWGMRLFQCCFWDLGDSARSWILRHPTKHLTASRTTPNTGRCTENCLVVTENFLTVLSMYPRVGIFLGDEAIPMLFLRSRGISSLFDPCGTPRNICSTRLTQNKHYRRVNKNILFST